MKVNTACKSLIINNSPVRMHHDANNNKVAFTSHSLVPAELYHLTTLGHLVKNINPIGLQPHPDCLSPQMRAVFAFDPMSISHWRSGRRHFAWELVKSIAGKMTGTEDGFALLRIKLVPAVLKHLRVRNVIAARQGRCLEGVPVLGNRLRLGKGVEYFSLEPVPRQFITVVGLARHETFHTITKPTDNVSTAFTKFLDRLMKGSVWEDS